MRPQGNKGLAAVRQVVIAIFLGPGGQACGIRAAVRLAQAKKQAFAASGELTEKAFFLLSGALLLHYPQNRVEGKNQKRGTWTVPGGHPVNAKGKAFPAFHPKGGCRQSLCRQLRQILAEFTVKRAA